MLTDSFAACDCLSSLDSALSWIRSIGFVVLHQLRRGSVSAEQRARELPDLRVRSQHRPLYLLHCRRTTHPCPGALLIHILCHPRPTQVEYLLDRRRHLLHFVRNGNILGERSLLLHELPERRWVVLHRRGVQLPEGGVHERPCVLELFVCVRDEQQLPVDVQPGVCADGGSL